MKWLSKLLEWFGQIRFQSKLETDQKVNESVSPHVEEASFKRVVRAFQQEEEPSVREAVEKALNQAKTWRNRAAMAHQQNNLDLCQKALDRMFAYLVEAAKLQGREPPTEPPKANDLASWWPGDEPPGGSPPWNPHDPSRVPRNPLPSSGAGEVALPLPKDDSDLL